LRCKSGQTFSWPFDINEIAEMEKWRVKDNSKIFSCFFFFIMTYQI
jgi:hypothetical protein